MTETSHKINPMGVKPIPKLLLGLAVPSIIANLVNALYNVVDQIFIGQGIGYLGNAATNIAFPLTTISLALGLMAGLGGASNFNLELGRKNIDKARSVAATAVTSLLVIGVVLCIVFRLFLEPLMVYFGATDQILAYAMEYTGITSFGIPFFLIGIGTNPLVRADGSPTYSMVAIIIGALLNTILDPLFIFYFQMGIAGAAWATVISQAVSACILLAYFRKFKTVSFKFQDFIPRWSAIKAIMILGFPAFIFQFSAMIIQISTNNLLKVYGAQSIYGSDIPIAISGIVAKINVIFTSIVMGIVQGSQPICGFNYGAKKYGRVKESITLALKWTLGISICAFIIFEFFPRQILSFFGPGEELYFIYGIKYMRVFLMLVFLNGLQIGIVTFFPSIGKAWRGASLSISKQLLFLLPLLFILPLFFGVDGIMYAQPITDFLAFSMAAVYLVQEFKKLTALENEVSSNHFKETVLE